MSHDPLPPENSVDIYDTPKTTRRNNHNNTNIVSLFLSSLFMNFNVEPDADGLDRIK